MEAIQFPDKLQCLFQPMRYKVLWGGRAGAKSWGIARAILLIGATRPLRVLCARELQHSLDESVHKLLCDQIEALGLSGVYTVQRDKILGPRLEGWAYATEINFEGVRHNVAKIKSYEGIDLLWVEEADKTSKASWEILDPTIRKEGSEIWVSFNTGLETDYTYKWFIKNPPKDAVVVKMSWRDNPWLTDTVKNQIQTMKENDFDTYLHIWEGECKFTLDGAIYAKELREVILDGRICRVPWERSVPVDTYWDLGRGDHTAIWFAQYVGFEYRILDYYQDRLVHLDHYLKILQNKPYIYGTHWLPHDAQAKTLGTKKSVEEQVRAKFSKVRIVPKLSVRDGISAARTIFPNCWFDEKLTAQGVECLKNYKFKVDPETKTWSKDPLHDEFSDGADGFRYMAIALKEPKQTTQTLFNTIKLPGFARASSSPSGWMR